MTYDGVVLAGLLVIAAALALPFDEGNQRALRDPVFTLYLLSVVFLYLAFCWRNGGMTLGMRAWKLRLLPDEGEAISWKTCFLRYAISMVSIALLGLGFLWSIFDRHNRCWHDLASHSGIYRMKVQG